MVFVVKQKVQLRISKSGTFLGLPVCCEALTFHFLMSCILYVKGIVKPENTLCCPSVCQIYHPNFYGIGRLYKFATISPTKS